MFFSHALVVGVLMPRQAPLSFPFLWFSVCVHYTSARVAPFDSQTYCALDNVPTHPRLAQVCKKKKSSHTFMTRMGQLGYLFRKTDRWTSQNQVRCQPGRKVAERSENICETLLLGAAITNPKHRVLTGRCVKHGLQRDNLDEIEIYALGSEKKQRNTALSASKEPN